jgi:hypothetical protein
VLTVAVSVSAGVDNIISAVEGSRSTASRWRWASSPS